MSKHWSCIRATVDLDREELRREYKVCYEGVRIKGLNILDVRELVLTIENKAVAIQRVYIKEKDSNGLEKVGWIVNDGITICLCCSSRFSSTSWRHHCRTCGLIVCNACCEHLVGIKGFEKFGYQRVCKSCNPSKNKMVSLVDNTQWGRSISELFLSSEQTPRNEELAESTQALQPTQSLPMFG